MAKSKSRVNKTAAIKRILKETPNASPLEIQAMLSREGVEASAGYISTTKSKWRKIIAKSRRTTSSRRPKLRRRDKSDEISISALVETKRFAEKVGGVAKLKTAIDALAKLEPAA